MPSADLTAFLHCTDWNSERPIACDRPEGNPKLVEHRDAKCVHARNGPPTAS